MSAPTTGIRLNKTTPAAPSGQQNIVFASDGGTPQQNVTASDPVMVGDTGTGGVGGNVPAPPAGSAAAGKFLSADGTFAVPPGNAAVIGSVHAEPLTDGNGNFIFAGGDIIVVVGVPNGITGGGTGGGGGGGGGFGRAAFVRSVILPARHRPRSAVPLHSGRGRAILRRTQRALRPPDWERLVQRPVQHPLMPELQPRPAILRFSCPY